MSQNEVVKILKKVYPKWLVVSEIADQLGVIKNSISTNMRRLRFGNAVKWRLRTKNLVHKHRPMMEYQYKK